MKNFLEYPIFICGHRKGGTTVALCLLDSHPQLLTFPIDSAFFYAVFPHQVAAGVEQTIAAVVQKTLKENLTEELTAVGAADQIDIDQLASRYAEIARSQEHSAANHLRALIQAYGELCGQDSSRWKAWVEKTTSTEIYAQEVARWFPNARFIHITRDPRDNWASLKSGWEARYKSQEEDVRDLIQTLIDRAGLGLRMATLNQQCLGAERYHVLRLEDFTADPDGHTRDICAFLDIEFDDMLKTPTVAGQLWKGNNFEGLKFSRLDNTNSGRWKERIPQEDAALIEAHLGDVMSGLNYDLACSPQERSAAATAHYKWSNFKNSARFG